jgi:hypothetical protein
VSSSHNTNTHTYLHLSPALLVRAPDAHIFGEDAEHTRSGAVPGACPNGEASLRRYVEPQVCVCLCFASLRVTVDTSKSKKDPSAVHARVLEQEHG